MVSGLLLKAFETPDQEFMTNTQDIFLFIKFSLV